MTNYCKISIFNKLFKIMFFLFLLCFMNNIVMAQEFDDQSTGGRGLNPPVSTGGGYGSCGTLTGHCGTNGELHPGGFRFTLVDENGNIVPGTKSVDITGSQSFYDAAANHYYLNSKASFNGYTGYYYHKYGIGTSESNLIQNGANPQTNLILLNGGFNGVNFAPSDPDPSKPFSFEAFKPYILGGDSFLRWDYRTDHFGTKRISFFDYFLHQCGYLTVPDKFTLSMNRDKHQELIDNNYYLIVEPIYEVYFTIREGNNYNAYNFYATVSELAYNLVNQTDTNGIFGYSIGLSGNTVYNISSYMCTKKVENDNPRLFSQSGVDIVNGLCVAKACPDVSHPRSEWAFCTQNANNYKQGERLNYYTASKDWGYGVATIAVSDFVPPRQPEEVTVNNPVNIKLDLCESNDGIVGVHPNFPNGLEPLIEKYGGGNAGTLLEGFVSNPSNPTDADRELFRVQRAGLTAPIYCFDDVTYDFSSLVTNLSGEHRVPSNASFSSPSLRVTRTCIYKDTISSYNIKHAITESYNKTREVVIYGTVYEFTPRFDSSVNFVATTDNVNLSNGSYHVETVSVDTYYYVSKIAGEVQNNIPNRDELINVPIFNKTFNNGVVVFGPSVFSEFDATNKVLKFLSNVPGQRIDLKHDVTSGYTTTHYNSQFLVSYSDGAINSDPTKANSTLRCDYDANFLNYDYDLKFRTISLNNPFPARDGSARMPSDLWLSDSKNKVYDYITANRGVRYYNNDASGEALYSTDEIEPMYTVTLTPSTMLKIREYNKLHNYGGNSLNCNSNGRECYSTFLRDSNYFSSESFAGACVLSNSSDNSVVRNILNSYEVLPEDMSNQDSYYDTPHSYSEQNQYDLNKNGRIDQEDKKIYVNYYDSLNHSVNPSNTKFYTCANKSYFSGGPVGGDR